MRYFLTKDFQEDVALKPSINKVTRYLGKQLNDYFKSYEESTTEYFKSLYIKEIHRVLTAIFVLDRQTYREKYRPMFEQWRYNINKSHGISD